MSGLSGAIKYKSFGLIRENAPVCASWNPLLTEARIFCSYEKHVTENYGASSRTHSIKHKVRETHLSCWVYFMFLRLTIIGR